MRETRLSEALPRQAEEGRLKLGDIRFTTGTAGPQGSRVLPQTPGCTLTKPHSASGRPRLCWTEASCFWDPSWHCPSDPNALRHLAETLLPRYPLVLRLCISVVV